MSIADLEKARICVEYEFPVMTHIVGTNGYYILDMNFKFIVFLFSITKGKVPHRNYNEKTQIFAVSYMQGSTSSRAGEETLFWQIENK